jgi:hypothetical protein
LGRDVVSEGPKVDGVKGEVTLDTGGLKTNHPEREPRERRLTDRVVLFPPERVAGVPFPPF